MSSKRKKMQNLMRLKRSQTKAKKAYKATNYVAPTEPSVRGYKVNQLLLYSLDCFN